MVIKADRDFDPGTRRVASRHRRRRAIHAEDIRWPTGLELEHNQLMHRDYLTYTGPYRYLLRLALQLCATTALASLIGCAPSALTSARSQISAGNYAAARQQLVALSAHENDLSAAERRELKDDLCLSDFMIGRPTTEQRSVCADAMKEPGSHSAPIVAKIDDAARRKDAQEVEAALSARDLAGAERAAADYQRLPDADPALLARWSKQVWALADEQVFADASARKRSLGATISEVRKNYPNVHAMNDDQFTQWIVKTSTASGTALASRIEIGKSTLKFSIDDANLQLAALSLDKLAAINDAMAARCGCDAHTNVSVTQTGFPAYVIRLDPETRMSEVMILPRGDRAIVANSAN